MHTYDRTDLDVLLALAEDPRGSYVALADQLGLSRNTVQARVARLEEDGGLLGFDRRIDPERLGHPLTAFITLTVRQKELGGVIDELRKIPEVLQAHGLSGAADLLCIVACRDAHHLFAIDAAMLAVEGVERTETSLSMGELIPFRLRPLIERVRQGRAE